MPKRTAICVLCCAAMLLASASARAAMVLSWSQDGKHFRPLSPVSARQSATRYYNFFEDSGHPRFGTEPGVASIALYRDSITRRVSLMLVAGHDESYGPMGHGAVAKFALHRLPTTTRLDVLDAGEDDDFSYRNGRPAVEGLFHFTRTTAGLVFGGLEKKSFLLRADLRYEKNLELWRLMDGGRERTLNMDRPLYLRGVLDESVSTQRPPTAGSGGSIPEPSGAMLLGLAGLGLLRRACRAS